MPRKTLLFLFIIIEALFVGITAWGIATDAVDPYGSVYVYFVLPAINIVTVGLFFFGYFSGNGVAAKVVASILFAIYFGVNLFFNYALLHDLAGWFH